MKILLLEDEYALRISVKEFLEDIGYEVDCFMDGQEAYEAIYDKQYDVLLLDVNVPSLTGFDLLINLKKDDKKIPTIFLTAMVDISDLKKGYEAGCFDYLKKPFDLEELELRVSQLIKSFYGDNAEIIELKDNVKYDLQKGQLTIDSKEVVLRKTEKEMLELLIKNQNIVVSLDMFQESIWGEYVDPATIRVQLKNLRKKLPDDIIQNRRGLGYIIER